MLINKDSFTHGQITSKIWLCEELENLQWSSDTTHIYGGWYAMTAFLLFSRGNFKVNYIASFDIDPECESVARMINDNWVIQRKFNAHTSDCSNIVEGNCDLIINTSTEHFSSTDWFHNIPAGTRMILQGNNMLHDDHFVHSGSLSSFIKTYPLSKIDYLGSRKFDYAVPENDDYVDWDFTRYMIIGTK